MGFLRELNSGYRAQLAWVAAHEQIMPRSGYVGITLFLQQHYYDLFQGGFMMAGTDSVIDTLSSVVSKAASGSVSEDLKSEIGRSLNTEFSKILEKLNVKPVESKVISINAFGQMGETGILFGSISEQASRLINEKIVQLIQNPSTLLSGQTEMKVNFQKTIDLSPVQIMFPSDMGLPVQVELNAPVTVSLLGRASIKPLSMIPSIDISGKALLTTQFSAHVGTICPFTREFVVSGINQHSIINVPGAMEVKLDIPSQKLSVMVRPVSQVAGEVPVGHYHIQPYTTVGQINKLETLTQTSALKPIRSVSERKRTSLSFGGFFGLGLETMIETESSYIDNRSLIELVQIYKNPINMMVFGWTSPALSEHLTPSIRYHKMTTLLHPAQTSTKEIGIEIKIGAATKVSGESAIKYHTLKQQSLSSLSQELISEIKTNPTLKKLISAISPLKVVSQTLESVHGHERRQQSLKEVMSHLETSKVSEGELTALTLTTSLILKSTRPRTFTYTLTAAHGSRNSGSSKIHHEWNLMLESQIPQTQLKKVSVSGKLTMPILPMWNIEHIRNSLINFEYENKMALTLANGKTSEIITTGTAKTSEEQKSFSSMSSEAKQLRNLIATRTTGASSKLIAELEEIVRIQASTLDKVVFQTEYVNVPRSFEVAQSKVINFLKAYLYPCYCPSASTVESHQFESLRYKSTVQVSFHQQTPSFDLEIVRPTEKIFFRNVRVSYPYNLFFPLSAIRNNVRLAANQLVSGSVLSTKTCTISGFNMNKFNGQNLWIPTNLPIGTIADGITIALDASNFHRFGVIARCDSFMPIRRTQWETIVLLKKDTVVINKDTNVLVNDRPVTGITTGKPVIVKGISGQPIATLEKTSDGVIILRAPRFNLGEVRTNGYKIEVIPSVEMKNKLGGLCGNFMKPIVSQTATSQCVMSKPELEVASWMIPSASSSSVSSSVPSHLMSELKKETEMCSKVMVQPTKVAKAYKAATGRCTILRHLIMQRPGKMCFSKVPVTQCGPSCKSQGSEMTVKPVPFTCLPLGRQAEHYMNKVQSGEPTPELASMETSYTSEMRQPAHCVHALVSSVRGF